MIRSQTTFRVAIACGGTGGHFFPGLAVAEEFLARDCTPTLLVSPKEVDQQAIQAFPGIEFVTLPAVALNRGAIGEFIRGFWRAYQNAKKLFRALPPHAVLAMGGFTSAPAILASKCYKASTFLHEANTVPGRANRWLAPWVDQAFVSFPNTVRRLQNTNVLCTGMPVRTQFQPMEPAACRMALRLSPERPTLLVMGGSQGARSLNDLVMATIPKLSISLPELQYLHLTGPNDLDRIRNAYTRLRQEAAVFPFLTEMELALGAATAAVSRAGASSLAEFAAMQVPAILIPYPSAADDHQYFNARYFAEIGAARMVGEKTATPDILAGLIIGLIRNEKEREPIRVAIQQRHAPEAAAHVAEQILKVLGDRRAAVIPVPGLSPSGRSSRQTDHIIISGTCAAGSKSVGDTPSII
jgi:UDP-N-acetylglucosamine--N-acetylmuramyl-(pentapeptide) pyrophosphoryl-undecaprenol N-acetylglucosamine transferase